MSVDLTNSKSTIGAVYPENAVDSPWQRLEPLLTPQQIRDEHLFGIPLYSGLRDPITGKPQAMTDALIQRNINRAVSLAETETCIDIMPVQIREKQPWEKLDFENGFGFMRLDHRPISVINRLSVVPSNQTEVLALPLEWVETGHLQRGQINLLPLTLLLPTGGTIPAGPAGAAIFLSLFSGKQWLPAFWMVDYIAGYVDGMVPLIINELVGTIAAMEVLSVLAATHKSNSSSLGIDGMSQSVSTPGPQVFRQRMEELAEKRKGLVGKIKSAYGTKLFSSSV